ncbi:hypothetical protein Zmor_014819 [Zophobas morio]|uniref:Uncharacterized protein n=1 Tax=Zophobas morio TaxID=2755281 RepID=A0AA38IIV7_9CUCU|nr:hypothetical protein Zmor_014819 [Zophobas morio]
MSSGKFWETMNLLIGKEYRRTGKEVMEDVDDWVDKVIVKKEFSVEESETDVLVCNKSKSSGYFSESWNDEKEVEEFIKSIDLPKIECTYVDNYKYINYVFTLNSKKTPDVCFCVVRKLVDRTDIRWRPRLKKSLTTCENSG